MYRHLSEYNCISKTLLFLTLYQLIYPYNALTLSLSQWESWSPPSWFQRCQQVDITGSLSVPPDILSKHYIPGFIHVYIYTPLLPSMQLLSPSLAYQGSSHLSDELHHLNFFKSFIFFLTSLFFVCILEVVISVYL